MYEGSIASVTPTVCSLFRIGRPKLCAESIPTAVQAYTDNILRDSSIERCLIYCPDALGNQIWSRCPEHVATITAEAPQRVHLPSVLPPKTPVCFASMFTGAQPHQHGIRRYERPVLACDTLFDAVIRSSRRVAIVAVQNCSIDLIFRNRAIDYYSEAYDQEVTTRALATLSSNIHDLVVVYHQEYDDLLHQTHPYSDNCLAAAERHVASFRVLSQAARDAWQSRYRYAIIFAPDHGCHTNPETGKGDHSLDITEDMSVSHWYGVFSTAPQQIS